MTKKEAKYFSEILNAYSEGKTIQYRIYDNGCGEWEDIKNEYTFQFYDSSIQYRVKPEPKHIPYNNGFDFLESQKIHGPYLQLNQCSPFKLPTVIYNDCIEIANRKYSYKDLFEHGIWQDGTPCSILEE